MASMTDYIASEAGVSASPVRGLPLPVVAGLPSDPEAFFTCSSLDDRGRLGDRSAIRELGWKPGTPIGLSLHDRFVIAHTGGPMSISRQGYLRVPASVRHRARLRPGRRLLVVLAPDHGGLVLCPGMFVGEMLRRAFGEGRP